MIKQVKHTYGGMSKDISKSRYPNTSYFDGKALTVTATEQQSSYVIANERGTKIHLTFPSFTIVNKIIKLGSKQIPFTNNELQNGTYGTHKLVGSINVKDGIVFFTTGEIDCIWLHLFQEDSVSLLYARKMGFSQDHQITGVSNYENSAIEKIYWVDGVHQLRHLNIRHAKSNGDYEDIIDVPFDNLNMVSKVSLTQPLIKEITTGGIHTAGVIQYAYSLYRLNGGQSQPSPLSEQVALGNGSLGGADVNQPANTAPIVRIEDIDSNYTNIKVYAIKYTSYGVPPSVSIIYDQTIPDSKNVEIFDDGSVIQNITLEEFLFLSSNIIIPKHLATKDNYMFYSNYEEKNYSLDLDVRAYSFNHWSNSPIARVYSDVESLSNLNGTPVRLITPTSYPDNAKDTFDNINIDYDTYKYSLGVYNGQPTIGGSGKYLSYEVIPSTTYNSRNKYFKDQEVYRIGIMFYNAYGKTTNPMWISDFKAPNGNMTGKYNSLRFTLKPAFYTWLNTQAFDDYTKPVGYHVLIAERGLDDRTIITSGLVSTMMINPKGNASGYNTIVKRESKSKTMPKIPNILMRNINENSPNSITRPLLAAKHMEMLSRERGANTEMISGKSGGKAWQFNKMLQLFSPDTIFNQNISLPGNVKMRVKGLMKNTYNAVWAQEVNGSSGQLNVDGKGEDGISIPFTKNTQMTEGVESSLHDTGLVSHPGGSDPNVFARDLFYRRYGISSPSVENAAGIDEEGYNIVVQGSGYYWSREDTMNFNSYTGGYGNASLIQYPDSLTLTLSSTYDDAISRTGLRVLFAIDDNLSFDYKVRVIVDGVATDIKGTAVQGAQVTIPNIHLNYSQDKVHTIQVIPSIKRTSGNPVSGSITLQPSLIGTSNFTQFANNTNYDGTSLTKFSLEGGPILFVVNNNTSNNTPVELYQPHNKIYSVYGRPEFAVRGQNYKAYNKDNEFRYINTLQPVSTDNDTKKWKESGIYGRRIVTIDSDVNNNITLVPTDNTGTPITLEEVYANLPATSATMIDCVPYIELIKSDNDIYLGGLYGGNSYEDKLRTKYVQVGNYNDISNNITFIESPGDTFVQVFKFLRVVRRDEQAIHEGAYHMEEIIEFPVETTIDLENRSDASNQDWDAKISYSNEEYHNYNRVYSQPNNLNQKIGNEYNVKEVNSYETNVTASKLKTSGELIDNWLDMLPNESLSLDGKMGPVTNLMFLNDEIYTLQDRALAKLSINPRVQVQGNDGVSIELGTGQVLQDYQYVTTSIGCSNKHASIVTPYGIYFYDSINKRLIMFNGQITPLSEAAGLHTFFYEKDLSDIDVDKPLKGLGMSNGYDPVNNRIHFSFLTTNESFTLTYSEKGNFFMTADEFTAKHYCGYGDYFYSNQADNIIHQNNKGDYNSYYGIKYPTKVTFIVNPEADLSVVVNNIAFKSEAYVDGVDKPDVTLTHIRAYNEYQDSGIVPLVNSRRGNIQRLFREWNAQVPRVAGTRERMRNPWTYLELTFENPGNHSFILHDTIVSYTI